MALREAEDNDEVEEVKEVKSSDSKVKDIDEEGMFFSR
jgi:hypothetical protein